MRSFLSGIFVTIFITMPAAFVAAAPAKFDFESGTVGTQANGSDGFSGGYIWNDSVKRTLYSNTRANTGSQSAQMDVASGVTGSGATMDVPGGGASVGDEIWVRVSLWVPSSYDFDGHGAAHSAVKFLAWEPRDGTARVYASRSNSRWVFASEPDPGNQTAFSSRVFPRDQWVDFEYYIKVGTSDASGILRLWENGTLIGEKNIGTISSSSNVIDGFRFIGTWNDGAPQNQSFWIDDMVFYNSAVGDRPDNFDAAGNRFIGSSGSSVIPPAARPKAPVLQ